MPYAPWRHSGAYTTGNSTRSCGSCLAKVEIHGPLLEGRGRQLVAERSTARSPESSEIMRDQLVPRRGSCTLYKAKPEGIGAAMISAAPLDRD